MPKEQGGENAAELHDTRLERGDLWAIILYILALAMQQVHKLPEHLMVSEVLPVIYLLMGDLNDIIYLWEIYDLCARLNVGC